MLRQSRSRTGIVRDERSNSSRPRHPVRSRSRSCPRSRSRSNLRKRRTKRRTYTPSKSPTTSHNSIVNKTLNSILSRLNTLESKSTTTPHLNESGNISTSPVKESNLDCNQNIVDVLSNIITPRNYYVSNFDPVLHDINAWFEEVDRARLINRWDDMECLSRVAGFLKGDAKTWLNEWSTNDRSWTNFKKEFSSLCPRRLDYANILFEAMQTNSDKYPTYAEYARRTLLRLRIIKGLSEELIVQIIIRGITEPQVRVAAANANLLTTDLVSFLSVYNKPPIANKVFKQKNLPNRKSSSTTDKTNYTCFICNQRGHKSFSCPQKDSSSKNISKLCCTFCKKLGHTEKECFAKSRSDFRKVNLCKSFNVGFNNDISTAVIQGVAIDVLIDSGALEVSLISSNVLKYLSCQPKPTHVAIKGISDREIIIKQYVTLNVEFRNITVEVDLLVVPSSYMTASVIIGTDVLNRDGIVFMRTKDQQYLTHSSTCTKICSVVKANTHTEFNTPLVGEKLEILKSVINEFSEHFISGTATSTVKTGTMHIRLTDDTPIVYHPYKLSYQEKLKVREIIRDLLDKGIIRESESSYSSPIILVKKKDGSDRMCVDFRALNRVTIKDRYPMPLIDDCIDRLGSCRFFSSLDMATGFHQIPLDDSSIHKTGFVTPEGHYEYMKMPFGLTNSPVVYQRIINNTLRKFIDAGEVIVYVDDVLLLSSSIEEGIRLLREVLMTLTNAGFSINLRKCSFLTEEIEYLGRVVSRGQVKPSPRKISALVNAPVPENIRQVRQFLGLAGYFRRYVKDYASKTACIARLTKKDVKFEWGSDQERVRLEIITALTSEPILAIFNPSLATELHTDASSIGYGAVLMQIHMDGKKKVIAYFSKLTQGAESRYHSYELETLAVVKALQHYRHYLIGLNFKIVTDCNALKSTERKKDLLPRVARWWVYMQDFTFTIEYRKGTMMSHADYLSRNPPVAQVNHIQKPRNWAQIAQAADNETQQLMQKLSEGHLDMGRYVNQNDVLYYRYSVVGEEARLLCYIPKGHRLSLLRIFHDEHDHIDAEKTIDLILKHFWFPSLRQFVRKYIAHCLICITSKRVPRAPLQYITSWEKPETPFHTLHVDVLGPLPQSNDYKFVIIIVDSFTKFCLLYAIYRQDVSELKRIFLNTVSLFGAPKLLVCDKGRMFESAEFIRLTKELSMEVHYITPEVHHANGQVERYVRTVLNMIRIETRYRKTSWSETLWKLQLVLNITKQKTTQTSALNLLTGIAATTPLIRSLVRDVAVEGTKPNREAWRELSRARACELLSKNQGYQDCYANQQRRPPREFKVDDFVFVIKFTQSTGKLDPGMRGPYRVTKVLPSGRYALTLLSGAYGKTTQAAAQYMVPWKGEWCPDTCAAFFEGVYCY